MGVLALVSMLVPICDILYLVTTWRQYNVMVAAD